jgi:phage I-like protein
MRITLELNKIKSGDRVLILPMGEINGRDGRRWVLTPEDAEAIVAKISDEGVDIVVDFDHSTHWQGGKAAGWLAQFQVEERGVTAAIEFTPAGQAAVDAREYRYLSPAFLSEGERILRLLSVALVNDPNIADLPALNKKQQQGGGPMDLQAQLNAMRSDKEKAEAEVARLAGQLKARETELLTEVNSLKTELAARDQKAAEAVVAATVEKAIKDGKLAPAQKDSAIALGLNSRQALESLIANSPLDLKLLEQAQAKGKGDGGPELDEVELQVCRQMGVNPDEFKKTKAAQA